MEIKMSECEKFSSCSFFFFSFRKSLTMNLDAYTKYVFGYAFSNLHFVQNHEKSQMHRSSNY